MIYVHVFEDSQLHSLKLHFLNQIMRTTVAINRGEVVMGTEANKTYLKENGLYDMKVEEATSNDLIVIVDAQDETVIDEIIEKAQEQLEQYLLREIPEQKNRTHFLSNKEVKSPFFLREFSDERMMGRIQSVFRTSFNVQFQDKLLNFSTIGMSVSPHGCVITKEKMDRVLANGKPGDLVKLENKVFTFYTTGDIFVLDVTEMEEMNLKIPRIQLSLQKIEHLDVYQYLSRLAFHDNMGLKNEGAARESFQTLKEVNSRTQEEVEQAVHYLIGRGDGLTPSGDDVLLGFTMIRQAFLLEDSFIKILEQGTIKRKTTAVSTAYYDSLFAGYVNSLFLAFIFSITPEENNSSAETLVDLITRYGHTSGYDTLFGIYLGFQSLYQEGE